MKGKHTVPVMTNILKSFLLSFYLLMIFVDCSQAVTVERVLATVNKEIITLSDYKRFLSKINSAEDAETVNERVLKNLIEEKIILQEAKNKGIDATDAETEQTIKDFQRQNNLSVAEFEKRLAEEGISLSDYKKLLKENIISLKLIDKEVNSKVIVTDEDVSSYYLNNIRLFIDTPAKLQVKAVFLKLSDNPSLTELTDLKIKSLKIYTDIKNGELFDKMVDLYSEEILKNRNGLLGEFEKSELIPALDRRLSEMSEDEVSEPVWTKEGVYILKLVKKMKETYVPLEKIRTQLYSTLYEQKKEEKFSEWMKTLWGKSSIKIKQQ